VTGTITTWTEANQQSTRRVVVPAGATAVLLNVTAVSPTGAGYLSIRPGNATGVPATAGLNFAPGDIVANAITVAVPATGANAGQIGLYYGTPVTGASMHVVADIVGYTTNTGLLDLVNRVTALENEGVAGPAGPKGDPGVDATGLVQGEVCVAGGIAGTIQTSFDAASGSLALRCSRPGYVTTFAGTGAFGFADGTGTNASFARPAGVAVDTAGNVYVADNNNHLIRKITPAGVVTTLAGTASTEGANNATGTTASFRNPTGVAVDTAGNIYVADTSNHLIRKITPAGVVTTLAGTVGVTGSTNATGTDASFSFPQGVAVDTAGNVYVADYGNHLIRMISPVGVVTTLAGNVRTAGSTNATGTDASFFLPQGVAVDTAGNVYVADTSNHLIRKITPAGVVTTLAGTVRTAGSTNATGTDASFMEPFGVAVDTAGNVYVADTSNHLIRKISPAGVVTTLAGNVGAPGSTNATGTTASFFLPQGVAVDTAGNVYVADYGNHLIRMIN
jgi:sugar lactone lactonase YvrE